ncbi:MAG TPA: histidine kinase dimerization/phospho-acceptor domain-containing protein, partial [bacterium]
MKRAARSEAKPKKKAAPAATRIAEAKAPARPPVAKPAVRQGVIREIGAAEEDERRESVRLAALQLENSKLKSMVSQFETILHPYVSAFEKLSADNNKSREAVKALQQEVNEKTDELQRNLIEKEAVRNYLSTILESLPNGVITTDMDGSITGANRTAKDILDQEGSALLGENINTALGQDVVPPSDPVDPMAEPISFARGNGESFKLALSVTAMMEGSHQTGYVVNLQDVTLLKKLEEQSARRNRFTVMGEMAANIAHEIRNPLGSIELFASLVRKGLPEEDEKMQLMHRISSAITSMNHIISNVLEYTKPRAVTLKELDLHTLLRELEGFFSFQCEQNGVQLELGLEAADCWIRADREMLKQVFHNLLLN